MLEGYIARTPDVELLASFNDPVLALTEIRNLAPELAFLDIQMPDLDGLELSRMLPPQTRVIFTTAFKQYAFESYEVSALDFLLKPIRYQKFLEAVQKGREWFALKESAAAAVQQEKDWVYLKTDGVLRKVEYADILYVEGMKDYLMVHLRSQKQPLVTHLTMKAAEDMLPKESFMRIHRSFIVNLPASPGVPVSRRRMWTTPTTRKASGWVTATSSPVTSRSPILSASASATPALPTASPS